MVSGLDGSAKMLARAAENLCEYGHRINFVQDDALAYLQKQEPDSIDAIVTVFALHNNPIDYRSKVFAAAQRVIREGGIFVMGDKIAQDNEQEHQKAFAHELSCLEKFDEMGRPDHKQAWLEHYAHDDTPEYRQTEREVMTGLATAGFSDVQQTFRLYMDAVVTARKR
jgi:ubiquinone/menaquinone biosynthesis C-methylase UbiE